MVDMDDADVDDYEGTGAGGDQDMEGGNASMDTTPEQ